MKCHKCHREININWDYCAYCGFRLLSRTTPKPVPEYDQYLKELKETKK